MKSKKLWAQIEGDEKNPLLIFFHGFLGSHKDFDPVIEILRQKYLCLSLDLPGHGNSKDIASSSIEEFDYFILDALSPYSEIPKTLVGYSMGGRIAVKLSKQIKPKSIVLISTRIQNLTPEERSERAFEDEKKSKELKEDYTSFLTSWYDQTLFKTLKNKPQFLEKVLKKRALENPSSLAGILKLVSPAHYLLPDDFLNSLNAPLLYLCGMEDTFYFSQKDLIQDQKKNAWIFTESESSHSLHLEEPRSVSQIINQFHRYYHDRMD